MSCIEMFKANEYVNNGQMQLRTNNLYIELTPEMKIKTKLKHGKHGKFLRNIK